jgi:hypothetical protein
MEMTPSTNAKRPPMVVLVLVFAIAAFIAVASLVQAVRENSWAPVWSIGWLPAVLVGSLWTPASRTPCGPRLRRLLDR